MEHNSNSFRVNLSNESKIFTNNKVCSFRSQIPNPIYLEPQSWEVGLTQIFFPKEYKDPGHTSLANLGFCVKAPGLIEEQEYNSSLHPILELVPYVSTTSNLLASLTEIGDQFCMHWDYPLYKNVLGGYINHIYIEITDTTENVPIQFQGEKLHLSLNFRRR